MILRKAKIPVSVRRDGTFYASEAVRDFYMMVSSFMFCDEPKYIFNYLLTPYAGEIEPMDLNAMERLSGDKVSFYDVYNFLKLNVATNRSEGEVKVESKDDYTSVFCMTVHKSKGLEFDTVVVPYTNENFGGWPQTELLVDPIEKKVGWYYSGDKEKQKRRYKYPPMKSSHYDKIHAAENQSDRLEGVRILYVGMTRAIDMLICIIEQSRNPMSWAKLIEEVGVDYE